MADRPGSTGLPRVEAAYKPYERFVDAARRAAELVVKVQKPGVVLTRNWMPHDVLYIRDMETKLAAARAQHVLAGQALDELDEAAARHRRTRDLPTMEQEQSETE